MPRTAARAEFSTTAGADRASEVLAHGKFSFSQLRTHRIACEYDPVTHDADLPLHPDLYTDRDFFVESSGDAMGGHYRNARAVKLGNLYIAFQRGGKGSFSAVIYTIDRDKNRLRFLLNLTNFRYGGLEIGDVLPFNFVSEDIMATVVGRPAAARDNAVRETTDSIRRGLRSLALGEPVNLSFENALADLNAGLARVAQDDRVARAQHLALPVPPAAAAAAGAAAGAAAAHADRNEQFFHAHPAEKPASEVEIAAKIAAVHYASLGILDEEIQEILQEYLDVVYRGPAILNRDFMLRLAATPLDRGRYTLLTLLPAGMSSLEAAIRLFHSPVAETAGVGVGAAGSASASASPRASGGLFSSFTKFLHTVGRGSAAAVDAEGARDAAAAVGGIGVDAAAAAEPKLIGRRYPTTTAAAGDSAAAAKASPAVASSAAAAPSIASVYMAKRATMAESPPAAAAAAGAGGAGASASETTVDAGKLEESYRAINRLYDELNSGVNLTTPRIKVLLNQALSLVNSAVAVPSASAKFKDGIAELAAKVARLALQKNQGGMESEADTILALVNYHTRQVHLSASSSSGSALKM